MSNVKLGVTLYSFSTEYCQGKMTLEDCIRTAKELGAADCCNSNDSFLPICQ